MRTRILLTAAIAATGLTVTGVGMATAMDTDGPAAAQSLTADQNVVQNGDVVHFRFELGGIAPNPEPHVLSQVFRGGGEPSHGELIDARIDRVSDGVAHATARIAAAPGEYDVVSSAYGENGPQTTLTVTG